MPVVQEWAVRESLERPLQPKLTPMAWIKYFILLFLAGAAFAEPAQVRRFEAPLERLRTLFASNDPTTVVDELVKGGRGPLFAVEGLARLYEGQHPKAMGNLREEAKWLEDRIGKLVDHGEHIKYTTQVGVQPATLAHLIKVQADYREALSKELKEKGWAGTSFIDSWSEQVKAPKWESKKDDRQYVLEQLLDLNQELRKEKWDIRDLQNGLHDFRRRTRWMTIYLTALGGLIEFDGRPLERFAGILEDPITKSPYGVLGKGERDKFPILVPREIFLELAKAIEELGFAKDTGEASFEWLPEALVASGESKDHKAALKKAATLVKKHPTYRPVFETGENILAHLRANDPKAEDKTSSGILSALKHVLEEQFDWKLADCRRALSQL